MPPTCSTLTSRVSASQSFWMDLIFWRCPDSSPFFQSFCLLLDQKWVYPVSYILETASSFAHATMSTSLVIQSWTTTGISPFSSYFRSFI